MYPLLAVSLLSITLCAERFLYWLRHREMRMTRSIHRLSGLAKRGEWALLRRPLARESWLASLQG